jgi:hypothetical protein
MHLPSPIDEGAIMTINISWHNPQQTILYHTYKGEWSLEDFNQSFNEMSAFCDSVNHSVHNIIDVTESRLLPRGNVITQFRSTGRKLPDNVASICIVGDSIILQMISKAFSAFPSRGKPAKYAFKICTTLEEASQWIDSLSDHEGIDS